jgi:hypothetical protein
MSTIINGQIHGINYHNLEHVNVALQPFCPLEGTALASQCSNVYHNLALRDDSACVHAKECSLLLASLQ